MTKVEIPNKVTWISAGVYHSAAIDETGDCYTWGSEAHGKLALKPDNHHANVYITPQLVENLNKERRIYLEPTVIKEEDDHTVSSDNEQKEMYEPITSVACGKYHTL